jgi:hypothetical protein
LIDIEDGRTAEGEHTIGDLVARASHRDHQYAAPQRRLCNLQAYEINRSNSRVQPLGRLAQRNPSPRGLGTNPAVAAYFKRLEVREAP